MLHSVITRIVTNLTSAAAYALIALVCLCWLVHWRSIGHRLLLVLAAFVCTSHALTNLLAGWELYRGGSRMAMWDHFTGAVLLLLFAMHLALSKDDGLVTLRTSEAEDRLRKEKDADREQDRIQKEFLAMQTRLKSEELVRQRESR